MEGKLLNITDNPNSNLDNPLPNLSVDNLYLLSSLIFYINSYFLYFLFSINNMNHRYSGGVELNFINIGG